MFSSNKAIAVILVIYMLVLQFSFSPDAGMQFTGDLTILACGLMINAKDRTEP